MTRLLALATVALIGAPLFAADPKPTSVVGVGIVSADQKTVFLPSKEGGIEAVDLATGKVLWVTKGAGKLAGASDKVVVAWAADAKKGNAFRVTAIDTTTGKVVGTSDPISMPDWAATTNGDGYRFRAATKVDGDEAVVVWEAGTYYAGGAAPTDEILAAAKKDASGLAKVDFKTGKVAPANGKPKDDDFKVGPAGGGGNKVGTYEFQITEEIPGFRPGAPMVTKVTFTVTQDKREVWKRELAGNPWLPPRP